MITVYVTSLSQLIIKNPFLQTFYNQPKLYSYVYENWGVSKKKSAIHPIHLPFLVLSIIACRQAIKHKQSMILVPIMNQMNSFIQTYGKEGRICRGRCRGSCRLIYVLFQCLFCIKIQIQIILETGFLYITSNRRSSFQCSSIFLF